MTVVGATVYVNLTALQTDFDWVVHTDEVLRTAEEKKKSLVDMETGLRGYLIAGRENFLEPYDQGQERFDRLMKEQQQRVSDNPPQVERLKAIEAGVADWHKIAAGPVQLHRLQKRPGT